MNNAAFNHHQIMRGYYNGLVQYSADQWQQGHQSRWYLLQDTTYASYNDRQLDLGYIEGESSNGLVLHNGLLVSDLFEPIGLLHQQVISRDRSEYGKRHEHHKRAFTDKESFKWVEWLQTAQQFSWQTGRQLVHVMDREADIKEVLNRFNHSDQSYVIRSRHDRSLLSQQQRHQYQEQTLHKHRLKYYLENLPDSRLVERTLRDGRGRTYQAECELKYSKVKLRGIDKAINVVYLRQTGKKKKRVNWILFTNLAVDTWEDALHIVEIYTRRWLIEDFHKCLKTGCSLEQRQFNSKEALTATLALLNLVAVKLLRTRFLAKNQAHIPVEQILQDETTLQVARALSQEYLKPVDLDVAQEGTCLWFILLLGRMGGHQGFRQKGLPGWITIWRGYHFLLQIMQGYNLAKVLGKP